MTACDDGSGRSGRSGRLERLAVYGTLGPGRPNHHHLADLAGEWTTGVVHGRLIEAGWGAGLGYPGIVLDAAAPGVPVDLLTSPDLAAAWDRLDAFEGPGYRRVAAQVETATGPSTAWIYVLAAPAA